MNRKQAFLQIRCNKRKEIGIEHFFSRLLTYPIGILSEKQANSWKNPTKFQSNTVSLPGILGADDFG